VQNIPIVAIAVPNNPPIGAPPVFETIPVAYPR